MSEKRTFQQKFWGAIIFSLCVPIFLAVISFITKDQLSSLLGIGSNEASMLPFVVFIVATAGAHIMLSMYNEKLTTDHLEGIVATSIIPEIQNHIFFIHRPYLFSIFIIQTYTFLDHWHFYYNLIILVFKL